MQVYENKIRFKNLLRLRIINYQRFKAIESDY